MNRPKYSLAFVAVALVVMLAVPVAAQAATIYVNYGVGGARLGMRDTTAARRLGTVRKIERDTDYSYTVWVRYFGKRGRNNNYALQLYSNGSHRVTAFVIYSSRYVTKKNIHVLSTRRALKRAYGKRLHSETGGYFLKGKIGKTHFEVSRGRIRSIWIWKI